MKKIGKSKIFFTILLILTIYISLLIVLQKNRPQTNKNKKIPFKLKKIYPFSRGKYLTILNKIEDLIFLRDNLILSSNCGIIKVKKLPPHLKVESPLLPLKKIQPLSSNTLLLLSKEHLYLFKNKTLNRYFFPEKYHFVDLIKKGNIIHLLTKDGKLINYTMGNFFLKSTIKNDYKNFKGFVAKGNCFYIYGEKNLFFINDKINLKREVKIDENIKKICAAGKYLFVLTGGKVLLFNKKLKYIKDLFFSRVIVDILPEREFLFFYSSLEGFIRVHKNDILKKKFQVKLFPLPFAKVKICGNYMIADNKIYKVENSNGNIFLKKVVVNSSLPISSYIKKIIFTGDKIAMLTFRNGILIFDKNLNLLMKIDGGKLNFLNSISTYKDKIIAGGDFGIFIINPKNNFSYKISEEFKNIGGCINCILEEKDKLFFGTSKGIYIYENGVLKGIFIVNNLPSNKVYTMLKWGNHLVCGGDAGFFFLNKDNYKMERSINSLNSNLDSDWIPSLTHLMGKILVGTYGGSIYTYDATCGKLKMLKKGKYFLTENCTAKVNDKITLLGTLNGNIFLIKNKSLEITEIPWIYGSIYSISKNKKEIFISSEGGILKIGEKELIKYLQKEKSKYN